MATDYTGKEVKVGDRVFFKEDVEGDGVVVEIQERRGAFGDNYVTFLVGSDSEPAGYPFHRMARMDHELRQMVVYTDRVWLYSKRV
jgi:hypothetical protein